MRGEPETILEQILQHWASEGEFYIGGFVLLNSLSRLYLHVAHFMLVLHKKK